MDKVEKILRILQVIKIVKAALPEGTVRNWKDGQYKKISGEWIKQTESCGAYNSIPDEIWNNKIKHNKPFKQVNDIIYEENKDKTDDAN